MRETVDLDGLGVKIFGKYLKFLQQKVAAKLDEELNPTPDPKTMQKKKDQMEQAEKAIQDNWELGSVHMSEAPIENSAQNRLRDAGKLVQAANRMANAPNAQSLDTSAKSISSRYRHENQNSIYFVKPNSSDIFFLDFKLKGFCKE